MAFCFRRILKRNSISIFVSTYKLILMPQIPFVFNQLVNFIPRDVFEYAVRKHDGNAYVKSYSCWNHLLVMLWAQLTHRHSLRDIESSLRAHSDKTYRMGIGKAVSRNNIANASAKRDVAIFREIALEMMRRCAHSSIRNPVLAVIGSAFGIKGFFAIDSSTVSLNLDTFSWSVPQEGLGGIKLHTMFDLMREVPRTCLITGHEERDQTFMECYTYERGCFYVFDRLYFKTSGLRHINQCGAYFVTRLKRKVSYASIDRRDTNGVHVLCDETVRFTNRWASKGYPDNVRVIKYYSEENNRVLCFVTNNFDTDARTIALIYKYRWQIELFFKWIKQHLCITAFYGTSANAVMVQIYTAIVAFCTLALAADALKFEGTLYEFANIMSVSQTEKCYLCELMARYRIEASKNNAQNDKMEPNLFNW